MPFYLQTTLAIVIGGVLIVGALLLLNAKKISLAEVATNPSLKDSAMKIEIEKLISVGTNVPALGLFLAACVLIFLGLYYASEDAKRNATKLESDLKTAQEKLDVATKELDKQRAKLTVTGVVTKSDRSSPQDVIVETRWPPFRPDANGKLGGLTVERDSDGRLPVLGFVHPQYDSISLDLNTEAKVEGSKIVIPDGSLLLRKLPGEGGTQ
jgi:hypothetical protein